MGGKYNNNVGIINNKIDFLSKYKFSIAMENTEADGYYEITTSTKYLHTQGISVQWVRL